MFVWDYIYQYLPYETLKRMHSLNYCFSQLSDGILIIYYFSAYAGKWFFFHETLREVSRDLKVNTIVHTPRTAPQETLLYMFRSLFLCIIYGYKCFQKKSRHWNPIWWNQPFCQSKLWYWSRDRKWLAQGPENFVVPKVRGIYNHTADKLSVTWHLPALLH